MPRLLIVDDHEVVREGLVAALDGDDRFEVVAAVGTGDDALSSALHHLPQVAIVDMRLPGMAGDELCRALLEQLPGCSIVVLSAYGGEDDLRRAMAAGAIAYLTKDEGLAELRTTLERVAGGDGEGAERQIDARLRSVSSRQQFSGLTEQRRRVLTLIADGLTYREVGERLSISESTVRFHIQKLRTCLGARSKADLVARAMRAGLVPVVDGEG